MARSRRPSKFKSHPIVSASWVALLAATTLGVDGANTVRAEVRADEDLVETRDYRLVVQSFDADAAGNPRAAKPVGSYQRAVTAAELRSGVSVSVVELRGESAKSNGGAVVAWIEAGKPDLEFDGRTSRPRPGSMVGLARRGMGGDAVQIRLTRKLAA
jgi:hypothetical protein